MERADLWHRGWTALGAAAAAQAKFQQASEPTHQFLTFLTAALSSGEVHVAGPDGAAPTTPEAWGWRSTIVGSGLSERQEWRPLGQADRLAGWDGSLSGTGSELCRGARDGSVRAGDGIGVTSQTLRKRLNERGLLASVDAKRETLTIRRMLEGKQRDVLHLLSSRLAPPAPEEPDKSDIDPSDPPW